LRIDSEASFAKAATQMIDNLDQQLSVFKDKEKEHPDDYKVMRTAEYLKHTGGESLDGIWLAHISVVAIIRSRCVPK